MTWPTLRQLLAHLRREARYHRRGRRIVVHSPECAVDGAACPCRRHYVRSAGGR